MEQMIEMMSQTGQGVAGKVELKNNDDEDGDEGEEGEEEKPDTKIVAEGMIFPILCHEIIKGLEEAKGRHGLPKDPSLRQKVQGQVDTLSNEPMQLRIGPEIVEKLRFALPDEMYDESNKGLINWFHTLLYQIPAQEFLEIIGNAISQDESKVKRATSKFKEIMREAQQLKSDFENYQEEEGSDSDDYGDDDDEDGLDDFLGSLGISRPK
jgi:FtsZ-binding cell division protein ZapB